MDPNSKPTQSTTEMLGTAASLAASAMLARSAINEFLPRPLRSYVSFATKFLRSRLSTRHTIVIEEREDSHRNLVYDAIETYLATRVSTSTARVKVSRHSIKKKSLTVSLRHGEEMIDPFEGIQFNWRLLRRRDIIPDDDESNGVCSYELSFHNMYKDVVFETYFPYILERSASIKGEERALRLHLNYRHRWKRMNLNHPATFDTLAMDLDLKKAVIDDLARFVQRKEYYKKIGKAWKRGYLVHGPPGTGKSSLVGAMANYLKFDIYDLELTEVRRNSTLKKLLIGVANKALLVIEDIDCSVQLQQRDESSGREKDEENVTLSGLLNFADGLWSSCGEERIIVFTTNYKNRLDPALLRPGRMDMQIHMDYCGVSAFRTLVSNYHDVDEHPLFGEIEELIGAAKVTPAEVAEELTRSHDTDDALRGLIEFLMVKRERSTEVEEYDYVSNVSKGKNFQAGAPPAVYRRDTVSAFHDRGGNSQSSRGRGRGRGRGRRVKIMR